MEMPYGLSDLRPVRIERGGEIACHVEGCRTFRPRQRQHFVAREEFLCPEHGIYLSRTTFQYKDHWRNLLWRDECDGRLMSAIARTKRTTARLGRERDEDALTWNVVRAFHREGKLTALAEVLIAGLGPQPPEAEPSIIYWGSDGIGGRWALLGQAQNEFGEQAERGTEPDLALWWPGKLLVFVEAKFCSGNQTTPSLTPAEQDHRPCAYGGHKGFAAAFKSDYNEIAVSRKKYELMRMWLLGSWIAEQEGACFCLVNLVRWGEETSIEETFGEQFCRQTGRRTFCRATWETIWDALPEIGLSHDTRQTLEAYLRNKTCGYGADGVLLAAFAAQTHRECRWAQEERPPACPWCGSPDTIPIIYGYPSPALERQAHREEVELGGCIVDPRFPRWRCRKCSATWGHAGRELRTRTERRR